MSSPGIRSGQTDARPRLTEQVVVPSGSTAQVTTTPTLGRPPLTPGAPVPVVGPPAAVPGSPLVALGSPMIGAADPLSGRRRMAVSIRRRRAAARADPVRPAGTDRRRMPRHPHPPAVNSRERVEDGCALDILVIAATNGAAPDPHRGRVEPARASWRHIVPGYVTQFQCANFPRTARHGASS